MVEDPLRYGETVTLGMVAAQGNEIVNGGCWRMPDTQTGADLKHLLCTLHAPFVTEDLSMMPYWMGVSVALWRVNRLSHRRQDFLHGDALHLVQAVVEQEPGVNPTLDEKLQLEKELFRVFTESEDEFKEDLAAMLAVVDLEWLCGDHQLGGMPRDWRQLRNADYISRLSWITESQKRIEGSDPKMKVQWTRSKKLMRSLKIEGPAAIALKHVNKRKVYLSLLKKTIGSSVVEVYVARGKDPEMKTLLGRLGMLPKDQVFDFGRMGLSAMSLNSVLLHPHELRIQGPCLVILITG